LSDDMDPVPRKRDLFPRNRVRLARNMDHIRP